MMQQVIRDFFLFFSLIIIILTLLMTFTLLGTRLLIALRKAREEHFREKWRVLIVKSFASKSIPQVPTIGKAETYEFMHLWNYYQQLLRGPELETLSEIAVITGIDQRARTLIKSRTIRNKLIAIETVGHLKDKAAWGSLVDIVKSKNMILVVAAARAMIMVDTEAAIPHIIPMVISNSGRAPDLLVGILGQARSEKVLTPLVEATIHATEELTVRVTRYLEAIGKDLALPFIYRIAQEKSNSEITLVCIRAIGRTGDCDYIGYVRENATHPDWPVRVQAATALGKIGTKEDIPLLLKLLSDKFWWVRYRAGQALARTSFCGIPKLGELKEGLSDKFAIDMIDHVSAEKEFRRVQD
jgi:hypothetical protein